MEHRAKNHVEEHRQLEGKARRCHAVMFVPTLQQFSTGRLRLVVSAGKKEAQQLVVWRII